MLRFTATIKLISIVVVLILTAITNCIAEQKETLLLNPGTEDGKGDMPSI
jgi:hypothetical protein